MIKTLLFLLLTVIISGALGYILTEKLSFNPDDKEKITNSVISALIGIGLFLFLYFLIGGIK